MCAGKFLGYLTPLPVMACLGMRCTPHLGLKGTQRLFLSKKLISLDLSRWRSHLLSGDWVIWGPSWALAASPRGCSLTQL